MLQALKMLGRKRAMVLVGEGGIDEVSATGQTDILSFDESGQLRTFKICGGDFGLEIGDYACGLAKENVALFKHVFSKGDVTHPLAKHVALSAALPLWMMGEVKDFKEGVELALAQIENKGLWEQYILCLTIK